MQVKVKRGYSYSTVFLLPPCSESGYIATSTHLRRYRLSPKIHSRPSRSFYRRSTRFTLHGQNIWSSESSRLLWRRLELTTTISLPPISKDGSPRCHPSFWFIPRNNSDNLPPIELKRAITSVERDRRIDVSDNYARPSALSITSGRVGRRWERRCPTPTPNRCT